MAITSQMVKELREKTNAGMMDCKKALTETDGDMDKAVDLLRQKGLAVAAKRSGKEANEGVVAATISADGKTGVLVEVTCETDFVAKTDDFKAFAQDMAEHIVQNRPAESDLLSQKFVKSDKLTVQDALNELILKMGENISIRKFTCAQLEGAGVLEAYIHAGGKLGVLVEVSCGKEASAKSEPLKTFARDIAMHIAAINPVALRREDVPADVLQREKDIYIKQAMDSGKPQQIAEKMVVGKMEKYLAESCLLEQKFVKNDKVTVLNLMKELGQQLGDELSIRRFIRYQIG